MISQCPQCQTRYNISKEQLQLANGKVRCGSCMQTFSAYEHCVSEDVDSPNTSTQQTEAEVAATSQKSHIAPAISKEQSTTSQTSTSAQSTKNTSSLSAPNRRHDDFDDFDDDFLIDDDFDPDTYSKKKQESKSAPVTSSTTIKQNNTKETLGTPSFSSVDSHKNEEEPIKLVARRSDASAPHIKAPPVEMFSSYRPRFPWRLAGWAMASTIAAAALALQYAWQNRDHLARDPAWQALYEEVCSKVECSLSDENSVKYLRTENLVVHSHPTVPNALLIDALIVNDAAFNLPYPSLNVTFSDMNDQIIAKRVFNPSEYVKGELAGENRLPGHRQVHISLAIKDPGDHATNYSLALQPAS